MPVVALVPSHGDLEQLGPGRPGSLAQQTYPWDRVLSVAFRLDRLAQASAAGIAGLVGRVVLLGVLLEVLGGMDRMGRTGMGLAGGILVLGEDTILVGVVDKACQGIQLRVEVDRHDPIVLGLGEGRTEGGTVVVVGPQGQLGSGGLGSVVALAAVGTVVRLALEVLAAVVVLAAVAERDEIPTKHYVSFETPHLIKTSE